MARILVADQDADIRALVTLRLRHSGHEVEIVGDGENAFNSCQENTPDLVVLDVTLPLIDGFEVCRLIRAAPELAHLPIMLLSAMTTASDVEAGLAAGADDHLDKPFTPSEFAKRVEDLLAQAVLESRG